jgi:hypothetical protein
MEVNFRVLVITLGNSVGQQVEPRIVGSLPIIMLSLKDDRLCVGDEDDNVAMHVCARNVQKKPREPVASVLISVRGCAASDVDRIIGRVACNEDVTGSPGSTSGP